MSGETTAYSVAGGTCGKVLREEGGRLDMHGRAAKGVLESGEIMHVEGHHSVDLDRFEQLGDVACRERIARRGAAVLARIGQIGHARGDAARAAIFQRIDEKQQLTEPVIGGSHGVPEKGLDHVDGPSAHAPEGAKFVLATRELRFLMRRERDPQSGGDSGTKRCRCGRREYCDGVVR